MSEQARDMVNTIIEVYIPEFQKIEKHLLQRYLYRDIIEQWF